MSEEEAKQEQADQAPSHDEQKAESSPAPEASTEPTEGSAPNEELKAEELKTEEPKKVNKVQERINQLTREKYEERQKTAALEARLKEFESNKPGEKEPELVAPNEDDFEDYKQFQSANSEYVAKLAANAAYERISAENKSKDEGAKQSARQETLKSKKASFEKNLESKRGNFQDFESVAYGHQFMNVDMAERLFDMDLGPEVAYHLGSHLDVAEKIFALDPVQQAIELTKLEFQVEALKPKKVSGAPDPITPLGSSEVVNKSEENMTDAEWLKWRNNQINARNKR